MPQETPLSVTETAREVVAGMGRMFPHFNVRYTPGYAQCVVEEDGVGQVYHQAGGDPNATIMVNLYSLAGFMDEQLALRREAKQRILKGTP